METWTGSEPANRASTPDGAAGSPGFGLVGPGTAADPGADSSAGAGGGASRAAERAAGDARGALEPGGAAGDAAGDEELRADLQVIQASLAEVEHALDRLADGSYGTCEACGQSIDDADLALHPAGRHCPAHLPLAGA